MNFTLCWFSLNNSETVKAVTCHFAIFSNISLETFMPNLVSLTRPSLQILGITQTGVFPISGFLVNPLLKKNCRNSRTSDDIDTKLEPVTKLDKANKTTPKNLTMTSCRQFAVSLLFFPSLKLTFSLIVTFDLTKTENRTKNKKPQTQLSHYCFE